jgi:hypothetical protein
MRYGTSHFKSVRAAERYYRQYGRVDVKKEVRRKIDEGLIHIGRPSINPGQSFRWDSDGRGEISEGK